MLATRLHAVGDLRLQEVPVPDPGPGEVLIRVEAAGICGTDRHLFRGEFPSAPPVTLGHEFAGHVVGRGAGVTCRKARSSPATRTTRAGRCDACRRGPGEPLRPQRGDRHPPRRRLRRARGLPRPQGGGAAGRSRPAARRLLRAAGLHAARGRHRRAEGRRAGAGDRRRGDRPPRAAARRAGRGGDAAPDAQPLQAGAGASARRLGHGGGRGRGARGSGPRAPISRWNARAWPRRWRRRAR